MTRSKTAFPLTAVKTDAINKSAAIPEFRGWRRICYISIKKAEFLFE